MPVLYLVLAAAVAASRPMLPEDLTRVATISSLEVSGDGSRIAYSVERAIAKDDVFRHELWLAGADGTNHRRLCRPDEDCTDPKFSPDGRRIAYLSDRTGATQLWIDSVGHGRARKVTDGKEGVIEFDWSPDGRQLVVSRKDPSPRAGKSAPWVITGTQVQRDGEGFVDGSRTHLYVLDAGGGTPRRLTSGRYDESEPCWSPSGESIAFVSNRNVDPDATDDSDIWIVPASGGDPRRLVANPGVDLAPVWSHKGDRIAFVGTTHADDYYRTTHVMVAAVGGGPLQDLTAANDDWVSLDDFVSGGSSLARIAWSTDDAALTVPFDRRGANRIGSLPSEGGGVTELLGGARVYGLVRVSEASHRLFFTVSTPTTLGEIWTAGLDGSGARKLLGVNDAAFSGLKLVTPEKIQVRNSAGDTVDAWLYPPVDRDPAKTYPLILYIHGGPQEFDGDRFEIGLENQIFPGKGWAVLRVNYRGSTSYGEAFSRAVWGDWHKREYEDLMGAADAAIAAHPWIDAARLGVGGWSYGGIMTVWIAGHTSRFKVGVPERFEIDYPSSYGTDHWPVQYVAELGIPWENEGRYRELSPGTYVSKITTPLFLIANEKDGNCPPTQAMQLYQRLKLRNLPTELVIYPGEPHSMQVPSHRIDRMRRLLRWFARYLDAPGQKE